MNCGVDAAKTTSEYQDRLFHCPDGSHFDVDSYRSTVEFLATATGFRDS
jgi:hypothetical protein